MQQQSVKRMNINPVTVAEFLADFDSQGPYIPSEPSASEDCSESGKDKGSYSYFTNTKGMHCNFSFTKFSLSLSDIF